MNVGSRNILITVTTSSISMENSYLLNNIKNTSTEALKQRVRELFNKKTKSFNTVWFKSRTKLIYIINKLSMQYFFRSPFTKNEYSFQSRKH